MAHEHQASEPTFRPNHEGYAAYIAQLDAREMSNSETYDRALLTLSSVLLGLSVTFINGVVSLQVAVWLYLLYAAWAALSATVITTLWSFLYGQRVIRELKNKARAYFLEGKKELNLFSHKLSKRLQRVNVATGMLFVLGLLSLTTFVIINTEMIRHG